MICTGRVISCFDSDCVGCGDHVTTRGLLSRTRRECLSTGSGARRSVNFVVVNSVTGSEEKSNYGQLTPIVELTG